MDPRRSVECVGWMMGWRTRQKAAREMEQGRENRVEGKFLVG